MCFSAPASFAAGGVLGGVGAASLKISRGTWRLVAAMPLLFAVQQALEGAQWLALERGAGSVPVAYAYLFFALILWPVYVPFVVGRLDPSSRVRSRWFLVCGVAVALWSTIWVFVNGINVTAAAGHVAYGTNVPGVEPAALVYLAAVAGAPLASRVAAFRWFGLFILAEALVAYALWRMAFASVWCFFAAVTSVLTYLYLRSRRERRRRKNG